jgi:hypothetical protein
MADYACPPNAVKTVMTRGVSTVTISRLRTALLGALVAFVWLNTNAKGRRDNDDVWLAFVRRADYAAGESAAEGTSGDLARLPLDHDQAPAAIRGRNRIHSIRWPHHSTTFESRHGCQP